MMVRTFLLPCKECNQIVSLLLTWVYTSQDMNWTVTDSCHRRAVAKKYLSALADSRLTNPVDKWALSCNELPILFK